MPNNYIISATAPDGKRKTTSISLDKYTLEQAKEMEKLYKRVVKAGQPWVRPEMPLKVPQPPPPVKAFEFYDLFNLRPPFSNGGVSFALVGSTRSGKSTALCEIYKQWFKKHITMLFTLSSHADIYECLKKKSIVCQGYFPKMLKDAMKLNVETGNKWPFLSIFDDLSTIGKTDQMMTRLLTTGRNSGQSIIISGQKLTMLSATGRSNVNYVLCFRQNSESAIEDTIKCFLRSYFPKNLSMPEMIDLYKHHTQNHQFFFIDTLEDKCYLSKVNIT